MKKSSFRFLIIQALMLMALPCFAAQNIISSVIISQAKDRPDAYELNIDSTNEVAYKTHIDDDGSVYFDLKNSTLAQNAGTVYDDVSAIDNVTVKQLDKNKVRIWVKGKNAQNTDIVFLNSLYETTNPNKKVVINRPIKEYQSTVDLENQEDIQDWDDNSFNFSHLLGSVLAALKDGPGGMILISLISLAIFAIIIKNLTAKLSQENEPLIGLNQRAINERAINQTISPRREEAIKTAQVELTKAHQKYQEYLMSKYQSAAPIKASNATDSIKKSIAINQYQRSNKNPYLDQEVIRIKKDLNGLNNRYAAQREVQKDSFSIPARPKMEIRNQVVTKEVNPEAPRFKSPYIQRPNAKVNYEQKTTLNPNNLRFLESVSKIYEKSGRVDLANELKSSMLRAKQNI